MSSDSSVCLNGCPRPKKSKTSLDEATSVAYWSYLPSVVIHEMFEYLDKTDLLNASTVCKAWRQNAFHSKWWPEVNFKIEPFDLDRAKFFTATFGRIVSVANVTVNALFPECTEEFVALLEAFSENNHLKELMIEPTHCNLDESYYSGAYVIETLQRCLPNLTKFSIGCIESFAPYLDEYLMILAREQAEKVTVLGLASVKENPNEYEDSSFECDLIKPFVNLKILSIDYEQLSDSFLSCLNTSPQLERLIVHLHGIREDHPGTSDAAWADFKNNHPNCGLRLTVIHSYDEILYMHETVLKSQMPLTHLKVFFCECINMEVLEFVSAFFPTTIRSIMWIDSLYQQDCSFLDGTYSNNPDPLIIVSWQCKQLEELVFYGYRYTEENLIAIARLRGDKLKRLEVAEADIRHSEISLVDDRYLIDIPLHLKRPWAPTKTDDLHPVIRCPTAGDSDEYLLPIVLQDLR